MLKLLVTVVLILMVSPSVSLAQATPKVSDLPTIDYFEGEWTQARQNDTDTGVSVLFLGPNGARVLVTLSPIIDDGSGFDPWNDFKDQVRTLAGSISGDDWTAVDAVSTGLNNLNRLSSEFVQAYRYDGTDPVWGEPFAVGVYEVPSDIAVFVAVTGQVNGQSGVEAMDAIALAIAS